MVPIVGVHRTSRVLPLDQDVGFTQQHIVVIAEPKVIAPTDVVFWVPLAVTAYPIPLCVDAVHPPVVKPLGPTAAVTVVPLPV